MNKFITSKCILSFVAAFLLSIPAVRAEINPKPFVIPELKSWTGAEGITAPSGRIVIKNAKAKAVAEALASDYQTMFGKQLEVATSGSKAGDIVLSIKNDKALGPEGYILNIDRTIELTATTEQGLFWATRSLLQISEQHKEGLPKGKTVDVPEYKLRGFMID